MLVNFTYCHSWKLVKNDIIFYSKYNWSSNEQDIVDEFNLDQELIEEYKENPDKACLARQTSWYKFVDMQNGKNY